MKTLLRIVTLSVLMAFVCLRMNGQSAFSVTLTLKDSISNVSVGFATVSLSHHGDSRDRLFALSDSSGRAVIKNVPSGEYQLKAELLGYEAAVRSVRVSASSHDLGIILMKPSTEQIDAATVSAVGNTIIVKKDTVEYDAQSFVPKEDDVLEDLLKKLPGVEVADDGTVTVNGETIKKITIDGKSFFLNDPKVATRNIPAKVIKKLKVIEKKSDQAEFTGIDDGERETVIDLSIEDSMMKGLFGNVIGGVGHDIPVSGSLKDGDYRYVGSAFIGKFEKEKQFSLILNGNNTNNRGATDQSRGMLQAARGNADEDNGINKTFMGGVNGTRVFFDGKMTLTGNYAFTATNNLVRTQRDKTSYLANRDLDYGTDTDNDSNSYGHTFGVRLEHKFSKNTSILYQGETSFGTGDYHDLSSFETSSDNRAGTVSKVNEGNNRHSGSNKSVSTDGSILFRQRLGIPGRTISLYTKYSLKHNDLDGLNQSFTRTFKADETYKDSIINQRIDRTIDNYDLSSKLTYTEPLGGGFYAEANYTFSWGKSTSVKNVFDTGNMDPSLYPKYTNEGETPNSLYSNDIVNEHINHRFGGNLLYQDKKFKAQLGFAATPTTTDNRTTKAGKPSSYHSNVVNYAPQASMSYNKSDNVTLRMSYSGYSSQPSVSDLMPVLNNANPVNVSFGNPYLLPYFTSSLRADYRFSNRKRFTSFNFSLRGNMVKNPIVNAIWYSGNGVQYSMPFNGADSWSTNFNTSVNSPIAKSHFIIYEQLYASYGKRGSYIGSDINTASYYTDGEFDYERFHADYKDITKASVFTENITGTLGITDRLRLTYRKDNLELQCGGMTRFNQSWYTVSSKEKPATWNNQVNASASYLIKSIGLGFDTQFNYNWYVGYTTPKDDEYIWNARISKQLFRKQITASLRGYDILNQAKNLIVSDSANSHVEAQSNTLGRYIILTVDWHFGKQRRR